jgi:hypothetical protein
LLWEDTTRDYINKEMNLQTAKDQIEPASVIRAHIDAYETEEQQKFILQIMTAYGKRQQHETTIPLYTCSTNVPEWQKAILNELFKKKGFEVEYLPQEDRNESYTDVCLVVPKKVNQ